MKKTLKWRIAQKAELQWWENYLKGKDAEQYHIWKKKYWQKLLDLIALTCPVTADMDVLDAGCGPSGMFMNLQNCHVDALDPLLEEYNKNLAHFKKSNYPYTIFHSMPLEQFASEKKYDIVFCMNAINHVSDLKGCYDLLANLVKPGGKLVVTIDAHNYSLFKYLFKIIPGDILHPQQYNLEEYEDFLTDRNFKIVQSENLKQQFFFDHYIQVAEKK